MEKWGIYIHVPWCRRRCPYCDFYFEVGQAQKNFGPRLLEEFEHKRHAWPKTAPVSLYFGGGTPSLMPHEEIADVISRLARRTQVEDWEVTLEANPEDLDLTLLKHLRAAGVDRLSIGLQSFQDEALRWLGRAHTGAQGEDVLKAARDAGFTRLSVDFIFGLPGDADDRVHDELEKLRPLGVDHVSAYLLTVEPQTPLLVQIERKKKEAPNEDQQAEAYLRLQSALERHGYLQYEVSSWSKPGFESTHNRLYWAQGSYLGLGPGAHSCRLEPGGQLVRSANRADLKAWWAAPTEQSERTTQTPEASFLESVAFGLRDLQRGVSLEELATRHRVQIPSGITDALQASSQQGWLKNHGEVWRLTPKGALFADAVAREILN